MSYSYLLDLYRILDERLARMNDELSPDDSFSDKQVYLQGRFDCLTEFKSYLEENYHQKLPRRIQKTYKP